MKATPHSAQAKIDYTFSLSTLGDLRVVEGNKAEALQLFEQALAIRRHLWEADRADVYARDRLAYMLMRVAEMHVLAGRHRTAGPLLEESLAHVRALPVQAKATIFTVTKVYLFLGEVARAQGRDPCLSYRPMAERLRQIPDADEAGHFVAGSEKLRDNALLRLKSCPS